MGQGLDERLADPEDAKSLEERVESEFVRCLVRQAGLVILGSKPAAVFGFSPQARGNVEDGRMGTLVRRLVRVYAERLSEQGVRLAWLATRTGRAMLLVWRPSLVAEVLAGERERTLLASQGLPVSDSGSLMEAFARRLRACYAGRCEFPHEIGLVLGYPIEDVEGFMADGGRGACEGGRWKVYGDPVAARRRMGELEQEERRCRRLYDEGVCVRDLLAMGCR